jgi:SNF2 family DNA or RNA helicase
MAARLSDLMLVCGVNNYPAWFSDITLPNWPMPHQLDTLKQYARKMRYLDASEPGTGKTFPAQTHAVLMAALGNKAMFAMPPKLILQFYQELKDFFQGIEAHLHIAHLDVPAPKKVKLFAEWDATGWPDILLTSYDVYRILNDPSPTKQIGPNLWFREDGSPYWKEKGVPYDNAAQPYTKDGRLINRRGRAPNPHRFRLKKNGYNVLFFDEAHALCGVESILSTSVNDMSTQLGEDVAIYLMTGTPVPTHLHDVYGLIRLINPEAYGSKVSFQRRHCKTEEFSIKLPDNKVKRVSQITGYFNTDEVYKALYANARRVQKRDVIEMADPLISQVRVALSPAHRKLYRQVVNDRFAVLGDAVLMPDNQSALRHLALQLISCPEKFDPSGTVTLDNELAATTDTLLDSINPANHKVIIFAYYQRTIEFLAERYAAWNPAVIYGAGTGTHEQVQRFKHDPDCRVAVINWVAGGAGLNLQVAHHIIFYECPTSPKDAKQAIARSDRKGQVNIVNVYFLRVMSTLLDRNFKNLLKNEEENNQVVRDKKDLLYELLR